MTRQREAILDVIRSDKCHHTAEEIYKLATERLAGISLATIYNSLKYLEEKRLIRRITAEGLSDRYDSSYIPHGHLFCTRCGAVSDFSVPDFDKTLADTLGHEPESYELKVRYVCEECRESEK